MSGQRMIRSYKASHGFLNALSGHVRLIRYYKALKGLRLKDLKEGYDALYRAVGSSRGCRGGQVRRTREGREAL